jgi:hypothetical protein
MSATRKVSGGGVGDKTGMTKNRSGPGRILHSAVVVDFISNPSLLSESDLESYGKGGDRQVQNIEQIGRMPKGSIIATIVSDKSAKLNNKPVIFFPLFSHLHMPIKPGEQVWVIYQRVDSTSGVGFWISRRVGPSIIEDPNYTHLDRVASLKPEPELSTAERAAAALMPGSVSDLLKFGSGGGSRKTSQTMPGTAPYQKIIENSISYNQFTGEPTPSFSKRCSDLLLQGSNNARIVLGEDRSGAVENNPDEKGKGAIDIVVGVGQSETTSPNSTGENTRQYEEVNRSSPDQNQNEGDPDFFSDLSRVYVSMNTDGDTNFSTGGISSLSTVNATGNPSGAGGFSSSSKSGPFVVAKSKHVRVISQQQEGDGTIRIVQLDSDGNEKSSICIDESGVVQIHGTNIAIGSGGATQPYIRFDEFITLVTQVAAAISTHSTAAATFGSACFIPVIGPMLAGPTTLAPAAATTTGIAGTLVSLATSTASSTIRGE